mmetsp:Transcript_5111/g.8837  ORF Transcript_5111/g.8837 Transcript_5111/m.8837 type:complete len:94 (-) Transcript_5111:118-399(-)
MGQLPEQLSNLTQLSDMDISGNHLVGTVPTLLCSYFNETFNFLQADCGELACPCCRYCCSNGPTNNDTTTATNTTTTTDFPSCVCVAELDFLC